MLQAKFQIFNNNFFWFQFGVCGWDETLSSPPPPPSHPIPYEFSQRFFPLYFFLLIAFIPWKIYRFSQIIMENFKRTVLKLFVRFAGKHIRRTPFYHSYRYRLCACDFIKNVPDSLRPSCFTVNLTEFSRTAILKSTC